MPNLDNNYLSWRHPSVAGHMRDLTLLELDPATYRGHPPFKYFIRAMEHVGGATFLDVGCGVGHYGELVARHYGHLRYTGLDFSSAMIDEARRLWPDREFLVADMVDFDYSPYDIVLASSLIEVMDDWAKGSEALCRTLTGSLILHRVRIHKGATVRNDTGGYPGQSTYTHIHNEGELLSLFEEFGFGVTWQVKWAEYPQATYVLEQGCHPSRKVV